MTTIHGFVEKGKYLKTWQAFIVIRENGRFLWRKKSNIQRININDAYEDTFKMMEEIKSEVK